jgi:glycosyltransferase involved in cell wall biosynthesis
LRILIYNWRDLTHPKAGGAEVYTDAVARVWINEGHEVTLFTSAVQDQPDDEVGEGGYRIVRRGGRLGVYREARRFWRREGQCNFDLVIDEVNTKPFGCPKWVKDVPVVALIHQVAREIWFHETWLPIALLGRFWLERRWLASYRDTTTVTLSASSRESLRAYGLRKVGIVPVGMDILPTVGIGGTSEKEKTVTFAFVGRLSSNKRPQDAIEAFAIVRRQLPDARLWVMGTGPMETKLRRKVPKGVEFLGRVSDAEKRNRLSRVHALLVTSVREGWGLVVTEAAMVGTRSAGYNVPGLCDSISASDGFLSDPEPGALAEVVIASVSDLVTTKYLPTARGVKTWSEVADQILGLATDTEVEHVQHSGHTPAGLSVVEDADGSRRAD